MGSQGYDWTLLNAMKRSPSEWNVPLVYLRGHLLMTEQQFNELVEYIRRYGHVLERGPIAINRGSGKGSKGGHYYYPTLDFGGGGNRLR